MEKKTGNPDRARQFMPFAALRGFEELIREQERKPEPRRTLSEEDTAALSRKLSHIARGSLIRVTHYDGNAYKTTVGMVSDIDLATRTLRIVKTSIRFDDISEITELNN